MRKYSAEQKQQLLNNLDLETSHRIQRFEAWLADHLANFRVRQEGLVSHIPKSLRNMPLRDFAKYNGDVQKALKGLLAQNYGQVEAIDKPTRKRKWIESQEQDSEVKGTAEEGAKPFKNARLTTATPKKPGPPPPGTGRVRLPTTLKTPSHLRTQRLPSATTPSPQKPAAKPFFSNSRPASPTKAKAPFTSPFKSRPLAPSSSQFNPNIPAASSTAYPRWPRRDENMLSVNGSPLANPFKLDLTGWLNRHREMDNDEPESLRGKGAGAPDRKRTASIIVRTASSSSVGVGQPHARTNSVSTTAAGGRAGASTPAPPRSNGPNTKGPPSEHLTVSLAALISVPTADGHLLEFDPFHTAPSEIDALEGISSSAKKKAKEDMRSLVRHAAERWRIE